MRRALCVLLAGGLATGCLVPDSFHDLPAGSGTGGAAGAGAGGGTGGTAGSSGSGAAGSGAAGSGGGQPSCPPAICTTHAFTPAGEPTHLVASELAVSGVVVAAADESKVTIYDWNPTQPTQLYGIQELGAPLALAATTDGAPFAVLTLGKNTSGGGEEQLRVFGTGPLQTVGAVPMAGVVAAAPGSPTTVAYAVTKEPALYAVANNKTMRMISGFANVGAPPALAVFGMFVLVSEGTSVRRFIDNGMCSFSTTKCQEVIQPVAGGGLINSPITSLVYSGSRSFITYKDHGIWRGDEAGANQVKVVDPAVKPFALSAARSTKPWVYWLQDAPSDAGAPGAKQLMRADSKLPNFTPEVVAEGLQDPTAVAADDTKAWVISRTRKEVTEIKP